MDNGLLMSFSNFRKLILAIIASLTIFVPSQTTFGRQETVPTGLISQFPGDVGWITRFTVDGVDTVASAIAIDGSRV